MSRLSRRASNEHRKGAPGRLMALVGAIVGGVTLATLCIPQFGPWLDFHAH